MVIFPFTGEGTFATDCHVNVSLLYRCVLISVHLHIIPTNVVLGGDFPCVTELEKTVIRRHVCHRLSCECFSVTGRC